MWNRQELKFRGKQAFQRNYGCAVGVALIMTLVSGELTSRGNNVRQYVDYTSSGSGHYSSHVWSIGNWRWFGNDGFFSAAVAGLLSLIAIAVAVCVLLFGVFVGNVLEVGGKKFFILNQNGRPGMGAMLEGFRSGHYGNLVLTMFLRDLFIFLWSLLLFVPGIIKYYEYLMVPYILSENPGMNREEAFLISRQMMNGQKWETFVLDLSYLGWYILSAFTCGLLAIFYVNPYKEATFAELYAANRYKAYREGYIR